MSTTRTNAMEISQEVMDLNEIDLTNYDLPFDYGVLPYVKNIGEAFEAFGLKRTDVIPRRDSVVMFYKIEGAFRTFIAHYTDSGKFDEAKEAESRLDLLRDQFRDYQMGMERDRMAKENKMLSKVDKEILAKLAEDNAVRTKAVEDQCRHSVEDMIAEHTIEFENLEHDLARVKKPHMKYSKRLLELKQAESSLTRLKQYDDAKNVNRMIKKIQPNEERAFNDSFNEMLESRRRKMRAGHEMDKKRIVESNAAHRWYGIRSTDKATKTTKQRMQFNNRDMKHAHILDLGKRPELSVRPSAHWEKRAHYHSTSSSLKGSLLADAFKKSLTEADEAEGAVFVEPLCATHDFTAPLQNTVMHGTYAWHGKDMESGLRASSVYD